MDDHNQKRKTLHVKIGVIGHTDYNRTLLNDAIRKTLEQNPDQIPDYDPIDACISPTSKISILDLANAPIFDSDQPDGTKISTTKKHQKRRK